MKRLRMNTRLEHLDIEGMGLTERLAMQADFSMRMLLARQQLEQDARLHAFRNSTPGSDLAQLMRPGASNPG
jgi:hypothetical protein